MTNEIAKKDEVKLTEYAVFGAKASEIKEIMEENVGKGQLSAFDLDRITVPSGGGLAFTVPSLDGPKPEQSITGVIIAWKESRVYWKDGIDESGGGSPPDCAADDGVTGFGFPGGECATCPLARFGSAEDGASQACKQIRTLFMIRPGDMLPICIVAPPTSLANVRKYFLRLAGATLPYFGVVTKLSLIQAVNKSGIKYAQIEPTKAGELTKDQRAKVRSYADTWKPAIEARRSFQPPTEAGKKIDPGTGMPPDTGTSP